MTILLAVTAAVCAMGWLKRYISTCALLYYIAKKGYTQPNDEELKECTLWATNKIFKR